MIDFSHNHFELFGLAPRFDIDLEALDRAYRALQTEVHPDRFAAASDAERRVALQSSARVNEAYRALRDPVERAIHLLSLRGIDARDETDTQLAMDFLEQQLERRERASDAVESDDAAELASILSEIHAEMRARETELAHLFDRPQVPDEARRAVRELRFLAKVAEDVDGMAAEVDG
jgi:molecular chaperone HscB